MPRSSFDPAAALALRQAPLHRARAQQATRSMYPALTSASAGPPRIDGAAATRRRRERLTRKYGQLLMASGGAGGVGGGPATEAKRGAATGAGASMASAPWTGRASAASAAAAGAQQQQQYQQQQQQQQPAGAAGGGTARSSGSSAFGHADPMPASFEWSRPRSLVGAPALHDSCLRAELESERRQQQQPPSSSSSAAAALAAAREERDLFNYKRSSNRSKAGRALFGAAPRRYGGQYTSANAEAMDLPFGARQDAQLAAVEGGAEHEAAVRAQRQAEVAEMRSEALARGQKGQLMLRRRGPNGELQSFIRDACS